MRRLAALAPAAQAQVQGGGFAAMQAKAGFQLLTTALELTSRASKECLGEVEDEEIGEENLEEEEEQEEYSRPDKRKIYHSPLLGKHLQPISPHFKNKP